MLRVFVTFIFCFACVAHSTGPQFISQSTIDWGTVVAKDGVKRMVVSGDPASAVLFSQRALFPAGYKGAPHTHPVDLHVVVIRGESRLGFSVDANDEPKVVKPGDYTLIPANTVHYEQFDVETEIHLYGIGPIKTVPVTQPKP